MPSPPTKRRILVQAGHNKPMQPGHLSETGAPGEAELVARIQKRLVATRPEFTVGAASLAD